MGAGGAADCDSLTIAFLPLSIQGDPLLVHAGLLRSDRVKVGACNVVIDWCSEVFYSRMWLGAQSCPAVRGA